MSIERKGSKFLARWEAAHPDDPAKRNRQSKSFDTERAAEMFLCNVAPKEHQWDLGRPLKESMVAWITFRRDMGIINEKTAERQFGIADNFGLTIPKKTVAQVTTEDIQSALGAMAAGLHRRLPDGSPGRRLKLRTRRQHIVVLGQFYASKLSGGHLRINPVAAIDRPSMPIEDPKEPTEKQVGTLLALLDGGSAANGNLPVLVTLLEITGIRRGEGLALEREDFDAAAGIVRITKSLSQTKRGGLKLKAPKSNKGTREVEVPAWFFSILEAHFARIDAQKALLGDDHTDRGLVFPDAFGGYLKPDTVSGQIAEAKRRAGWPEGVHGLHGLRHKFASHLAHSGQISVKDIAHALGHADEAFTLRVYVKRRREAPRTAHLFSQPRA
jgi:integrase